MSDAKETFKGAIEGVIGDYITNDVDLDNLVNYLYKAFVISFKDTDIQEEYKNLKGISPLDIEGFKRSLHTISISVSRELIFGVLKNSFLTLKNQIPLSKVVSTNNIEVHSPVKTVTNAGYSRVEQEFDINLEDANAGKPTLNDIAKVVQKDSKNEVKVQKLLSEYNSHTRVSSEMEFEFSPGSLDSINKSIPKFDTTNVSNNDNNDDGFDYQGDSSLYTDGADDYIPSVDTSLDY